MVENSVVHRHGGYDIEHPLLTNTSQNTKFTGLLELARMHGRTRMLIGASSFEGVHRGARKNVGTITVRDFSCTSLRRMALVRKYSDFLKMSSRNDQPGFGRSVTGHLTNMQQERTRGTRPIYVERWKLLRRKCGRRLAQRARDLHQCRRNAGRLGCAVLRES